MDVVLRVSKIAGFRVLGFEEEEEEGEDGDEDEVALIDIDMGDDSHDEENRVRMDREEMDLENRGR